MKKIIIAISLILINDNLVLAYDLNAYPTAPVNNQLNNYYPNNSYYIPPVQNRKNNDDIVLGTVAVIGAGTVAILGLGLLSALNELGGSGYHSCYRRRY